MMHAKYLCQIPQVRKGDASALRHLINHVSSHMNALKELLNVTFQDLMLSHLILASLDSETHQQWKQLTAARTDVPTTSELITFLELRCRALELIHNTQSTSTATVSPSAQQSARTKVSRSSYCNVVTPTQCTLCNELHRMFKCDQFLNMQPRKRHNYAKEQGLCFNSLQPFVKNRTCSRQQCRTGHKRHHTLLHIANQSQAANANRLVTNNNSPVVTRGDQGAEVNTYHTIKGKSRHHVLLATAIVEVRDKTGQYIPCRTLLDSGSQSHFITERCLQRLRLPKTQTHTSIQGISTVNTATHHSVSLHLRSRHRLANNTDCAVLPNITGMTPVMKIDISSWKIPKDIKLADESSMSREALIFSSERTYSMR
jgi:hypothetical protein